MQRRQFLRSLASAAGALAFAAPALASARGLAGAAPDPWAADFAAGLARHPWLVGWQDFAGTDLPERALAWHGTLPRSLDGTLYRNGPARFERAGKRYRHWFDGDGLVQAWRIGQAGASHRARMVGTDKFADEQAAGRFTRQAAGTWIEGGRGGSSDAGNTANTAMLAHAGRLYALWEGGSAWELAPDTLAARGPRLWREDLRSVPFSAHPLRDADGTLWNFGLASWLDQPTLLVWRIGADGALVSVTPVPLSMPGYLHSFAMTAGHLVFVIAPWLYEAGQGGAFFDRMRWRPARGSEAIVLAKDALDAPVRHALPAGLAFHYADAWQQERSIMLRACWLDDAGAANAELAGLMRGEVPANAAVEQLVRIQLPLAGGEARLHRDGPRRVEFPSRDERHRGPGGRLWFAHRSQPDAPWMDAVACWDGRREQLRHYAYGPGWLAEEHLFVPAPDGRRDRGWLVGTALDTGAGRLCLSVFDAGDVAAGPLCQAALPQTLPLGFHGCFVPA